jgi:hypothetical protein
VPRFAAFLLKVTHTLLETATVNLRQVLDQLGGRHGSSF